MNTDVEELLREGMERFTAGVRAPAGLADTARRLHRRRLAVRAAVACGTAAVTGAAAVAVTVAATGTAARTGPGGARAQTAAYEVQRVEKALAGTNLVFYGQSTSNGGPGPTWAYGAQNRVEEFFRGKPYTVQGTAVIHGKLTGVYVMYFNRTWSLLPEFAPENACSTQGALEMGGPPLPTNHWSNFINQTLACGAASVTHVQIDGVDITKITGRPVTVRLHPNYAKVVHEKWSRAGWTIYVNSRTYLPVRIIGWTETFGGTGGDTLFRSVTDAHWLRPTAANIAKTLVTIPPGFRHVKSPANQ